MTDTAEFLAAFFGHGNRSRPERHWPWIRMLNQGRPTVLPRHMRADDPELYCISPTPEGLEQVIGIVRASLGSRWIHGDSASGWNRQSAFDVRLEALAGTVYEGGQLYLRRLRIVPERIKDVARALERLGVLLRDAPPRAVRTQEGLAQLLRRVRAGAAVGHHGRNEVEGALQSLLDQGLLAPINVDFLRTWAWVEMGLFKAVLDHGSCERAQQFSQRPQVVTASIAKAVWHVDLEAQCESREFNELLRVYRDHSERRYGGVLEAFRAQDGWLADLYRALHGLAIGDATYCRRALAALDGSTRPPKDFIAHARTACAKLEAAAPKRDNPSSPEELVTAGRFDAAVEVLRHEPPSVERAKLLWVCALNVFSALDVLLGWRDRFGAAEVEEYRKAVPALAGLWEQQEKKKAVAPATAEVHPEVADLVPAPTWLEWLDRANHGGTRRDLRDAEPSRTGLGTRPLVPPGGDAYDAATRFHERLLASRPGPVEERVVAALPEMVGAWHGWDSPAKAKANVAEAITFFMAVNELLTRWPTSEFLAYADLLGEWLAMGVDIDAYNSVVTSLMPLVGPEASRASVERAIEFAEMLVDHPCPSAVARANFLGALTGKAAGMHGKLDIAARAALRSICRSLGLHELELPDDLPHATSASHPGDAEGRRSTAVGNRNLGLRVGAYTLEEGAGLRFKEIAEQVHGVRVVLNHDHVETTAIREMGRNTDVVIVVTRCAKHAATDAIRRHVDKEQIVYADGRGSSSMLRALESYLDRAA